MEKVSRWMAKKEDSGGGPLRIDSRPSMCSVTGGKSNEPGKNSEEPTFLVSFSVTLRIGLRRIARKENKREEESGDGRGW